ncbi:MAG: DsbA family protein [Gemmatimonadaceae bacterium]|nr:DsbA family protein [Gemmatimonadaceae bacterium]
MSEHHDAADAPRPVEELWFATDPLCGWCFAFRPVLAAVMAAEPTLPVRVLMGGLVLGGEVQPIAAMRDYIREGFGRIRDLAGVDMGAGFAALLDAGQWVGDSEPPCRAIAVAESLVEWKAVEMADAASAALYEDGADITDPVVLRGLAERIGLDGDHFAARFASDEAHALVRTCFDEARALGVTSYPLLAYRRDETVTLLAQGWTPTGTVLTRLAAARDRPID